MTTTDRSVVERAIQYLEGLPGLKTRIERSQALVSRFGQLPLAEREVVLNHVDAKANGHTANGNGANGNGWPRTKKQIDDVIDDTIRWCPEINSSLVYRALNLSNQTADGFAHKFKQRRMLVVQGSRTEGIEGRVMHKASLAVIQRIHELADRDGGRHSLPPIPEITEPKPEPVKSEPLPKAIPLPAPAPVLPAPANDAAPQDADTEETVRQGRRGRLTRAAEDRMHSEMKEVLREDPNIKPQNCFVRFERYEVSFKTFAAHFEGVREQILAERAADLPAAGSAPVPISSEEPDDAGPVDVPVEVPAEPAAAVAPEPAAAVEPEPAAEQEPVAEQEPAAPDPQPVAIVERLSEAASVQLVLPPEPSSIPTDSQAPAQRRSPQDAWREAELPWGPIRPYQIVQVGFGSSGAFKASEYPDGTWRCVLMANVDGSLMPELLSVLGKIAITK